jgi:hypothetical protein
MMDDRRTLTNKINKINMISYDTNLIIIMGSRIDESHIIDFFHKQEENTVIICMDKEFSDRDSFYKKNDNKILIQVVIDFNTIGPWRVINDNLIRRQLHPKQVILDWSTAKFVNANFAVNSEYGDIMDILMKWIEIFGCEIISPCSVETIYPLNNREKEPHYYNFFLYRTKVPFNLDIEAINIIWIDKFTEYLEKNHSNLALNYEENKSYPLNRSDKDIKAFFILHRKNPI